LQALPMGASVVSPKSPIPPLMGEKSVL
jgi:hypothetical protein